MDRRFQTNPFNSSNGFQLENQSSTAECSNRKLGNTYPDQTLANGHSFQEQSIGGTYLLENQPVDKYHHDDDCEFADGVVLKYMEQMLMEEGMGDEQTRMLQESFDFQAKERSFYELLVGHNSTSSDVVDPSSMICNDVYRTSNLTSSVVDRFSYTPQINDFSESQAVLNFQKGVDDANKLLLIGTTILGFQAKERSFYERLVVSQNQPAPPSSDDNYLNSTSSDVVDPSSIYKDVYFRTNNLTGSVVDRFSNPPQINDKYSESEVVLSFQKGVDDANRLLLIGSTMLGIDEAKIKGEEARGKKARSFYELLVSHNSTSSDVVDPSSIYNDVYRTNNLTSVVDRISYPPQTNDFSESEVVLNFQKGVDDANRLLLIGSRMLGIDEGKIKGEEARGKKKKPADFGEEEERSKKLAAVYHPETNSVPIQESDYVLHCTYGELEKKFEAHTLEAKGSSNKAKGYRNNQKKRKEVIDFGSLLVHCAQCIAADDRRAADGLLKEIREHSSPFGDGEQRLAHYIADGLEARLAGTGAQMQKSLLKTIPASDYLRAHYIYITSSPFVSISTCVSNTMILNKSGKANAARVHVIDFGILHGFQWPVFIKRLAERQGEPPKLKFTGIDFPQPGFRPAETVKETGRRLAYYAEKFNVPFEFNAIAQNWESIKIEDLNLEKGEFVMVNCLYRAENLLDEEAVGVGESPRTMFLNLIRKIKPDYFIHGVVSSANGSPFFVSRFREVLFHYSALYDMLETTMPRKKSERAMLESDIFGKEALNVIACENRERRVRTETYKQWRLRHLRAGFVQIPFERELMDSSMSMVRNLYHRDFLINEDKDWLLMGWKGKILYAMSCWQPVS